MTDEPDAQKRRNYLSLVIAIIFLLVASVECIELAINWSPWLVLLEVPIFAAAVVLLRNGRWDIAAIAVNIRYLPFLLWGLKLIIAPEPTSTSGGFFPTHLFDDHDFGEQLLAYSVPPYLLLLNLLLFFRKTYEKRGDS
jgi:hypothetical protein